MQGIKIDWLGVARDVLTNARIGFLICGPYDGVYTVSVHGSPVKYPAALVAIQSWKGTAYVEG